MNVSGMYVVVTGAIAGESRSTAEARLRDAGALVQSAVNGSTDLLVTGERVGATKIRKAEQLGVQVVPWAQVWNGGGSPENRGPAPVARAAARTVAPMLAKAGDLPAGEGWLFEVKWDGYRCIATIGGGLVTLQSRSGKSDYTGQFPRIVEALADLPDCVLDGELVDLSTQGGSFEGLVNGGGTSYVVFDVLETGTGGWSDCRVWPLEARRELLHELVLENGPVAISPAFEDGQELLAYADEHGLEGIVAKQKRSRYMEGTRTEAWLKIKLRRRQEFVIVGWKPGEGARVGMIGSVLLAYYAGGGRFVSCGRCGTGGTDDSWNALQARLEPAAAVRELVDTGDAPHAELRDVVWVRPTVVYEVAFQRWTEDGRLWHPSLVGPRYDKGPLDVRKEA